MQQLVYNTFGAGTDSVQKQTHFDQVMTRDDEMFNDGDDDSALLSSDSNDEKCSSGEFNINFSKRSSQNFGLGYYIKTIDPSKPLPLSCHKSNKSVFTSKSNHNSLSMSLQKPKRPINKDIVSQDENSKSRTKELKSSHYDIPRLKIPKHVTERHLKKKTKSPSSVSKSSPLLSSESIKSLSNEKRKKRSKLKSPQIDRDSGCKVTKESTCLGKSSFEKPNYFRKDSKSQICAVTSPDILCLTLTIDSDIYSQYLSRSSKNIPVTEYRQIADSRPTNEVSTVPTQRKRSISYNNKGPNIEPTTENTSSLFYSKSNDNSLSVSCDIPCGENKIIKKENEQLLDSGDSISPKTNDNSRKRGFNSSHDDDKPSSVSPKRQLIDIAPDKDHTVIKEFEKKSETEITPIDFLRFLTRRLRTYESGICEKYCLSQPNAMKFLAQNYGSNWELHKSNVNQMHLVPCEFLNEIFYRALHCFGLEKKILRETMDGNRSPLNGALSSSNSSEYAKIRDEYGFSLKRVRYGIGVIDELFRCKVNYQNIPLHDDMQVVRKWKHIIYYLCLHAKSAFMAKEMQYQHYVQFTSNPFDGASELGASTTPSVRCLSNLSQETSFKPQLPKEHYKQQYDSKGLLKTQSPEHLSQSDLDGSPHSNDSGKGSSIRLSSNRTGRNTSSLNSTPHSNVQSSSSDLRIDLPWCQLYRIDQYQSIANDYIRLLPDAAQLHQRIVGHIGTEPNANGRDNVLKLIYYSDICQQLCKTDLMQDCLQRLLTSVVVPV